MSLEIKDWPEFDELTEEEFEQFVQEMEDYRYSLAAEDYRKERAKWQQKLASELTAYCS